MRFLALLLPLLLGFRPAPAAEFVRGPSLQKVIGAGAVVRWELDRLGRSSLEYWREGGTHFITHSRFDGRKHRVALIGLKPGQEYRYQIYSEGRAVGPAYSFRAAAPPERAFTFGVFGDFGAATAGQMEVAALVERSPAELLLLTGDMIYSRGEEEHYDTRFYLPYRNSLPVRTFWPALGNHDVGSQDGAAALAAFDVPLNGPTGVQGGRNYSFDYGNAHFVSFDSNASAEVLRTVIGPWIEKDLAASKATWKFVFMHHPPYSSAGHGEDPRIRDALVPFLTRAKPDVVFSGHDHSYERTRPMEGVTYVVSGNGGNTLYRHAHPHDYSAVFYNKKHGLTEVRLDGKTLVLTHTNVDGEVIDRWSITKP
jgi:3',5'-cyclic AMP phosphodiesterase CpdA